MCKYCDTQSNVKIPLINDCCDSDGAYIRGAEIEFFVSYETGEFYANYCPMCGRNLKERK